MIGDILLIRASSTMASLNVALQGVLSRGSADPKGFSHVAIGSGPWQVFHAMPKPAHIEFAQIQEILEPTARFEVLRNRDLVKRLGEDSRLYHSLREEFSKHIGGAYNVLFSLLNDPDSSFCSQLVGRIAESLGQSFPKQSHWLYPNDISAHIRAHADWYSVTDEYRNFIAQDALYQRLWANPNPVDAGAFRSAYEHAKRTSNATERGWAAMQFGERPQTRLSVTEHEGSTVVRQTIAAPPAMRAPGSDADNPFCYRRCVQEWDKQFHLAAIQITEEQYEELLSLEIPTQHARPSRPQDPRLSPALKPHDAVFVLAGESVAKAAALMFDSLVPFGTDRIPSAVTAWDAPAAWRRGGAEMLALAAARSKRAAPIGLEVRGPDGSITRLDARDPFQAQDNLEALVSQLFLSIPEELDRVVSALHQTAILGCPAIAASPVPLTLLKEPPGPSRKARTWALAVEGAEIVDTRELSWEDILHIRSSETDFDSLRSFRMVFEKPWVLGQGALDQPAVDLAQQESITAAQALKLPTRRITLALLFDEEGPLVREIERSVRTAVARLKAESAHVGNSGAAGARLALVNVPVRLQAAAQRFGLLYLIDAPQ